MNGASTECGSTLTGLHQWSIRKRQLKAADGTRFHPTVKESWINFVGCVCGVEAPPAEEEEARKAWRETKAAARWSGEKGEQGSLDID